MNASPRRLPWASVGYAAAVQLGSRLMQQMAPQVREEMLRTHSTNLDNLRKGRWYALLTSAFLVEHPLTPASAGILLGVLGGAETLWGTRRAARIFALGHVGGSLAVYAGLRALQPSAETAQAVDVGVSYGANAVAGALTGTIPGRAARWTATAALVALGARPVIRRRRTFTDAGHLAALLIGLGASRRTCRPGGDHRLNRSFGTAWTPKRHPHVKPNRWTR